MHSLKRVLVMAGGTGGHVFPGLAVADFFQKQNVEVHWLGTPQGLESRLVTQAGLPFQAITVQGLRGKGIKPLLFAPVRLSQAVWQARRVIQSLNPDLVIGMGGFVSGPGGVASWLLKKPLIIHEQNAVPGLTNRLLAKLATRVLQGFPETFPPAPKVITVGNPVRASLCALPPPEQRFHQRLGSDWRLLVLGGSLGAQALNHLVPQALALLPSEKRPLVLHQTGEKHYAETVSLYAKAGVSATLHPFINEMTQAYAETDMVICRSGALTIAELCAVGIGSLLVPYPHAVDDHQTANASCLLKQQAALCYQQTELTAERLAAILSEWQQQPETRLAMAKAAYQLRHVQVAETVFRICQEVCP